MDIVDAQIHLGPGGVDEALAAMNALGIAAAVIDEFWFGDHVGGPGQPAPGGGFRPVMATAELASRLHPGRFCAMLRVDRRDAEVAHIIRIAGQTPSVRALRVTPGMDAAEAAAFAEGAYDSVCAAAAAAGLPLFIFAPNQPEAVGRYAARHPGARLVMDHCGLLANSMRGGFRPDDPMLDRAAQMARFEAVLAQAAHDNLWLKWGHATSMFELPGWPGEELRPILRRAIDAFGPRMVWASDFSVIHTGECWAELLFAIRTDPGLTAKEKAGFLGGNLRRLLNWPA